jgi:hypothetical protein
MVSNARTFVVSSGGCESIVEMSISGRVRRKKADPKSRTPEQPRRFRGRQQLHGSTMKDIKATTVKVIVKMKARRRAISVRRITPRILFGDPPNHSYF